MWPSSATEAFDNQSPDQNLLDAILVNNIWERGNNQPGAESFKSIDAFAGISRNERSILYGLNLASMPYTEPGKL